MTLCPQSLPPVPEATMTAVQAAFPKGNLYVALRAEFGPLYDDQLFADLYPPAGRPVEVAPWRLALVVVMQYIEGLTDRQAADAVRRCMDWKYALSLELTDPGFDFSLLHDFRQRLLTHEAGQRFLDTFLTTCQARGWIKARGTQRTDSTHVLAAIRTLNRLECVGETMRHALNVLAVAAPDWLFEHSQPQWPERYGPQLDDYRLPSSQSERQAYAELIGADGVSLLRAIDAPDSPPWLAELPALGTLRQVWLQNYFYDGSRFVWRDKDNIPPAEHFIQSPYDPQARFSQKRQTQWLGYKVHLTESCDEDQPSLLTHVETTPATTPDEQVTETIHAALAEKELLPEEHLLDRGYVDTKVLINSQEKYGVEVIGPIRVNTSWQAQTAEGFDVSCFSIDWEQQSVTCPNGESSQLWSESKDSSGNPRIYVRFAKASCQACPLRASCTRSKSGPRTLTFKPKAEFELLQWARQREHTPEFKERYGKRAGIESTISQGTRSFCLRRSRYIGLARTHLQHLLTAAAMNFVRVGLWLTQTPRAKTRLSAFQKLYQAAA
jgi:transposase